MCICVYVYAHEDVHAYTILFAFLCIYKYGDPVLEFIGCLHELGN